MGFFDKIKDNLSHGGVKVSLSAPGTVSFNEANFDVSVTITNSDEPRSINSVIVEILANSKDSTMDMIKNDANNQVAEENREIDQQVAVARNDQPFQIGTGETKTVNIIIPLNPTLNQQGQPANTGVVGEAMGLIQHLNAYGASASQNHLKYSVRASVHIEGIMLNPKAEQPLQVLS